MTYLFLITIAFFIIGFININLAFIGFLCFTLPFYFLYRDNKKTWCQKYCPRVGLFTKIFRGNTKKIPKWLKEKDVKKYVLIYFCINAFFITMSTIMVAKGRVAPIDKVRFLIAFQIPWSLPQLIEFANVPNWAIHLSYRIYSMMFTSTVVGLILAYLYKPRTWCTVCPINTISDIKLNSINKVLP